MALNCTRCGRSGGKQGTKLRYSLCGDCSAKYDKLTTLAKLSAARIKKKPKIK